jgi:hypothetical protein
VLIFTHRSTISHDYLRLPILNWLVAPSCLPYNNFALTEQKTPFPTIPLLLLAYLLPRKHVYRAEPLSSIWRLFWLHYSGLQASCHNIVMIIDLFRNYCRAIRNHMCSCGQSFVHLLLLCIAIVLWLQLPLLSTSVRCTELKSESLSSDVSQPHGPPPVPVTGIALLNLTAICEPVV